MGFRSIPIFVLKYETDVLFFLKLSSSIFFFRGCGLFRTGRNALADKFRRFPLSNHCLFNS